MKEFIEPNFDESASFIDEDLGGMMTAVALMPIEKEVGKKLFSGLKLA